MLQLPPADESTISSCWHRDDEIMATTASVPNPPYKLLDPTVATAAGSSSSQGKRPKPGSWLINRLINPEAWPDGRILTPMQEKDAKRLWSLGKGSHPEALCHPGRPCVLGNTANIGRKAICCCSISKRGVNGSCGGFKRSLPMADLR